MLSCSLPPGAAARGQPFSPPRGNISLHSPGTLILSLSPFLAQLSLCPEDLSGPPWGLETSPSLVHPRMSSQKTPFLNSTEHEQGWGCNRGLRRAVRAMGRAGDTPFDDPAVSLHRSETGLTSERCTGKVAAVRQASRADTAGPQTPPLAGSLFPETAEHLASL